MRKKQRVFHLFSSALLSVLISLPAVIPNASAATSEKSSSETVQSAAYHYTIKDVTRAQRIIAEYETAFESDMAFYDVNSDNRIDIKDITIIQQHIAQLTVIKNDSQNEQSTENPTTQPTTVQQKTTQSIQPSTEHTVFVEPTETPKASFLSLNSTQVTLGKNETFTLVYSSDGKNVSFRSQNNNIATISSKGIITPKSVGRTKVFCIADNLQAECDVDIKNEAKAVVLNRTTLKLGIGERFTLTNSIPTGTAAYSREYYSDNPNIAAVNVKSGQITAKSSGTTNIICKLKNGVEAKCTVTVQPLAQSLTFNRSGVTISLNESFDIDSYAPAGTAAYYRSYYSRNEKIAKVSKSGGVITPVGIGSTDIECRTISGVAGTFRITVTDKVAAVNLNCYYSPEVVGKTYRLTAHTNAGCDSAREFEFHSSDNAVVVISKVNNNSAVLTPMSQGTAYITVRTKNGTSNVCTVVVDGTTVKCIDVSYWNGTSTDFNRVKASGIEYVIMRAGFGDTADSYFELNYSKAKAAGLKVGVYWFSYSTTTSGGFSEANRCLQILNGKALDLPVYYDLEYTPGTYLGRDSYTQMAVNFCETIKQAGYKAGIYSSTYWYNSYLNRQVLLNNGYSIWNAHWRVSQSGLPCDIWQYSETGSVDGVYTDVDLSWIYNLNIL